MAGCCRNDRPDAPEYAVKRQATWGMSDVSPDWHLVKFDPNSGISDDAVLAMDWSDPDFFPTLGAALSTFQ
jgi:hypothetical protein